MEATLDSTTNDVLSYRATNNNANAAESSSCPKQQLTNNTAEMLGAASQVDCCHGNNLIKYGSCPQGYDVQTIKDLVEEHGTSKITELNWNTTTYDEEYVCVEIVCKCSNGIPKRGAAALSTSDGLACALDTNTNKCARCNAGYELDDNTGRCNTISSNCNPDLGQVLKKDSANSGIDQECICDPEKGMIENTDTATKDNKPCKCDESKGLKLGSDNKCSECIIISNKRKPTLDTAGTYFVGCDCKENYVAASPTNKASECICETNDGFTESDSGSECRCEGSNVEVKFSVEKSRNVCMCKESHWDDTKKKCLDKAKKANNGGDNDGSKKVSKDTQTDYLMMAGVIGAIGFVVYKFYFEEQGDED